MTQFGMVSGLPPIFQSIVQPLGRWQKEITADVNTILLCHAEDNTTSTTCTDESGNFWDGVATANTDTFSTASGKFNRGFNFNDTDYIDFSGTGACNTAISTALASAITIECQANWTGVADWSTYGDYAGWWHFKVDANNFCWVLYLQAGDNRIDFTYKAGGTIKYHQFTAGTTPVDTQGTFYSYAQVVSVASDYVKGFVDGVQLSGTTGSSLGTWAGTITESNWGYNVQWTDGFPGVMDEFCISGAVEYT